MDAIVPFKVVPNRLGGSQRLYRFENGLGASLIQNSMSYGGDEGQYELAVIRWDGDGWSLDYDTPITDDVLGYLDEDEVQTHLEAIAALT